MPSTWAVALDPRLDLVQDLGNDAWRGVGGDPEARRRAADAVGVDRHRQRFGVVGLVDPDRGAALAAVGVDIVEDAPRRRTQDAVAMEPLLHIDRTVPL